MEIKSRFDHFNINVTDLERSIAFYEKALGLKEHHRKEAADGSFILVYLTDNTTGFLLELTWLRDHTEAYELGENESHLCFRVAGDYDAVRQYHKVDIFLKPANIPQTFFTQKSVHFRQAYKQTFDYQLIRPR